jgi:Leucine-rich repeat (LRR) protein
MQKSSVLVFAIVIISGLIAPCLLHAQVAEQDSLALVAIYNSTNGAEWTNNENWLTGPVEDWYGIEVKDGRVSAIDLSGNNLSGPLPTEIGDLTDCLLMNLYTNQISGSLPSEVGNLTRLITLNLRLNKLTGSIPASVGDMTTLVRLYLNSNELTGSIPVTLSNLENLRFLQLNANKLTGAIPKELCALPRIESLYLNQNLLDGEIPDEIGDLTTLVTLSLHLNDFSGSIPATLGNLDQLQYLNLNNNELDGSIPATLGNLSLLISLDLWANELTGSVPQEITQCTLLERTRLNVNKLTGLPDLSSMDSLRDLQVNDNRLTFEDLEPNINIPGFTYSPQEVLGRKVDTTVPVGSPFQLVISVGGSANHYQWMKDGVDIPGAQAGSFSISQITVDDGGAYVCKITNTLVPDLTLVTEQVLLRTDPSTDIDPTTGLPQQHQLGRNYPNPFTESTVIPLELARPSMVRLDVHDLLGRRVRCLMHDRRDAGQYTLSWDGRDEVGDLLPQGVYLLQLKTPSVVQTRRIVVNR